MDKEFLASTCAEFTDNFATNIWKIAPFRSGNRQWLWVLVKGYIACLVACCLLACVLNSIEGKQWVEDNLRGNHGVRAYGDTALDECFWFVFTVSHGIAFGEFNTRLWQSRIVAMACVSLGYWFVIFLMSIVLLANLPGERVPSLCGVVSRMMSAVWPSYLILIFVTICIGATLGPYLSKDDYGYNGWPTGVYWTWTVVHRMPFGDIYPNLPYGRTMTVPAGMLGLLYMPYALALVAVRCPTLDQHNSLLGNLLKYPENALGRGYVVPAGANMREVVMQEYHPEPNGVNV